MLKKVYKYQFTQLTQLAWQQQKKIQQYVAALQWETQWAC